MAMLRQRIQTGATSPFHLVYVARTPDHVFYANELHEIEHSQEKVTVDRLYTRSGLPVDTRTPGRLTLDDLPGPTPATADAGTFTRVYVCGPTGFVEHAAQLLLARGHAADAIRTERFGPSG
jgi:ferredoxin-NADP reductase